MSWTVIGCRWKCRPLSEQIQMWSRLQTYFFYLFSHNKWLLCIHVFPPVHGGTKDLSFLPLADARSLRHSGPRSDAWLYLCTYNYVRLWGWKRAQAAAAWWMEVEGWISRVMSYLTDSLPFPLHLPSRYSFILCQHVSALHPSLSSSPPPPPFPSLVLLE